MECDIAYIVVDTANGCAFSQGIKEPFRAMRFQRGYEVLVSAVVTGRNGNSRHLHKYYNFHLLEDLYFIFSVRYQNI